MAARRIPASDGSADGRPPGPRSEGLVRGLAIPGLLLGVTALGAAIRCWQLGESLWLDELHTAWSVSGPLADLPRRAGMGNFSPAYFYLAWASTRIFGMNEAALRLPSLLAGVALIPLAHLALRGWTRSAAAGLLAGLLVAIDEHLLFYSLDARSYALVQLLALLHVMLLWSLLAAPRRSLRIGFVAATIALFYLHYTTVLLFAGEAVAYGVLRVWSRRPTAYRPTQALADASVSLAACLFAAPHLVEIAGRRENWEFFIGQPSPLAIFTTVPLEGVALGAAALVVQSAIAPVGRSDRRLFAFVVCWLCVPIVSAWLLTRADLARLMLLRYLTPSVLAEIALSCLLFARCRTPWLRVALAAGLVAASVVRLAPEDRSLWDGRLVDRGQEDWRGTVAGLRAEVARHPGPVFLRSGLIEADRLGHEDDPELWDYCLLPVSSLYRLDVPGAEVIPIPTREVALSEANLDEIVAQPRSWLLVRGDAQVAEWMSAQLRADLRRRRVPRARVSLRGSGLLWVISVQIAPRQGNAAMLPATRPR